jgi:hypothetical protein
MLAGALFATCGDAPRDNPLDPETGRYAPVFGHVMSLFAPHRPLQGVPVAAPAFGLVDSTDADGAFALLYLPPESVMVVTSGGMFAPCSVVVPPLGPAREHQLFYLNALPAITQASVASTHEERWWPEPYEEWITLTTRVEDADGMGDLDSVCCTAAGNLRVVLSPELTPGSFRATLDDAVQFPFNAEDFVGADFTFQAWDKQAASSAVCVIRLVRVVRDVGTLTAPSGLEEVGPRPVLRWIPPSPAYPSVLRARVIRVDSGVEATAWESSLFPALTDSAVVGTALSTGTYYWVLHTIDSFGNTGRSREAAFKVVS